MNGTCILERQVELKSHRLDTTNMSILRVIEFKQ